ncbi:MAG TPA: glycine cleavage system protein GcvH [Clostridiales bacterium]|nr:glycine cleavage system protein GcvH [Clostridiales bacterium]
MNKTYYTRTHEWVEFISESKARVGLTDFAQESMGDLVFINLPEVDDEVIVDESFADVESVKAVEDVLSPLTGIVSAINDDLLDTPELINQEPYEAWLVEIDNITEKGELLDEDEYKKVLSEEE